MTHSGDIESQRLRAALRNRLFDVGIATPKVGKYELREPLGEGAMGVVYRAFDPDLDRVVALKLLRPTRESPAAMRRMVSEAKALARLNHPNIVTVHAASSHGAQAYIAMEFVPGVDLVTWGEHHPAGNRARFADAFRLLTQAARALASAHRASVIHRDVKPSNILVDDEGRLRLVDFGLAAADVSALAATHADPNVRGTDASATRVTVTGQFVGTPAYMAPEQFAGEMNALCDQFSVCATFFELVYGVRPYPGETITALQTAIEQGQLRTPPRRGAPRWFYGLLARGLHADPALRYPTMEALLDALLTAQRRARRRPWVALVAAVGLGGLAAIAATQGHPCSDAAERFDAIVTEGHRAAVHSNALESDAPYATDVAQHVDDRVSALRDVWVTASTTACETGRAQSAGAQASCLDDMLVEAAASLDGLATVSADRVADLPLLALATLPDPRRCADGPTIERDGDAAQQVLGCIARGKTKPDSAAREALSACAEFAQREHLPTLEAEAALATATLAYGQRDFDEARLWAERGLRSAEQSGAGELEFDAWLRLSHIARQNSLDDAEFAVRRCDSALASLAEPRWRAALLTAQRAHLLWDRGELAESGETYRRAAAQIEPFVERRPRDAAEIFGDLGSPLLHLGEHADAITAIERTADIFAALHGSKSPHLSTVLALLAQANVVAERDEDALRIVSDATALLDRAPSWRPHVHGQVAQVHGMTLARLNRTDEAARMFEHGLTSLEGVEGRDAEAMRRVLQLSLADVHIRDLRPRAALELYAPMFEDASEPSPPHVVLRVNAALAHAMLGQAEQTHARATEALAMLAKISAPGSEMHIDALRSLSASYAKVGSWDLALETADTGLGFEPDGHFERGSFSFARAQALRQLGRESEAKLAAAEARRELVASGEIGRTVQAELDAWLPNE